MNGLVWGHSISHSLLSTSGPQVSIARPIAGGRTPDQAPWKHGGKEVRGSDRSKDNVCGTFTRLLPRVSLSWTWHLIRAVK